MVHKDLKIVFIPTALHEHLHCIVGKHVFIDKPWTKISHKKIIEDLQLQNKNSCFWEYRKKLEVIIHIIIYFYFYIIHNLNIYLKYIC